MKIRTVVVALALGAGASAAPMAAHAELVTNGGFETGNFSSWVLSGASDHIGIGSGAASGSYAASFGSVNALAFLSQGLSTTAGGLYTLSFDLSSAGGAGTVFRANWGSDVLASIIDSPGFGYTHFSYDVAANDPTTMLTFAMQHNPSYWRIDNISVVERVVAGAVPEPSTWAILIVGFGMLGVAMRRRRTAVAA